MVFFRTRLDPSRAPDQLLEIEKRKFKELEMNSKHTCKMNSILGSHGSIDNFLPLCSIPSFTIIYFKPNLGVGSTGPIMDNWHFKNDAGSAI
jgi:hypothetical protein